jgi:hypothetical protein
MENSTETEWLKENQLTDNEIDFVVSPCELNYL